MRFAAVFAVSLTAVLAFGSASAQGDIVKIFHFDQNGVLPSEDPDIQLFTASPSASETDVYSVSDGLLQQRTFSADGNYSYSFPDSSLTGGGLVSTKGLVMEARLRILEIEGVDGAFFEAFDGANRYGPLFVFDEKVLVYFDAQRRGPFVDLSDMDFSVFHTYRVESAGSTSAFTFSVDGSVVFAGNAAAASSFNGFEWGDGHSTGGNGADVDWDYVAFGQPTLVPTIVGIDIKPGSEKNNVNICAKGGIKVAILSAANFDDTQVDPLTVDLAGASVKLVGKDQEPQTQESDVNSDGITDLVLHVEATDIGVGENAGEAILNGQTFASEPIQGADAVNIKQQMCVRSVDAE